MGRWGSGPKRRWGKKVTVESCPTVDERILRGKGLLAAGARAGTLALKKGGTPLVAALPDRQGRERL